MNKLDPNALFERIAADVPRALHQHLFITGSLAAAFHYRAKLDGQGVNTKDADLMVHPAGDVESCQKMAIELLKAGWRRTTECFPQVAPDPANQLRAIRLFPPDSDDYFIEFLNLPNQEQADPRIWVPIQLDDGWYGLPSFRFVSVLAVDRASSNVGLEYAVPPMMALANLLAHPTVGSERIESGSMRGLLRSAKDLGRVLALVRLEGADRVEAWKVSWLAALQQCFPDRWKSLVPNLGSGLKELIEDQNALDDAYRSTDIGLLNGMNVTVTNLQAIGRRFLQDVIEPVANEA